MEGLQKLPQLVMFQTRANNPNKRSHYPPNQEPKIVVNRSCFPKIDSAYCFCPRSECPHFIRHLNQSFVLYWIVQTAKHQAKAWHCYFCGSKEAPLTISAEQQRMVNVWMLKTPVLVWSLKLSSIEPCEYLDGWPPGNTRCWRQFCFRVGATHWDCWLMGWKNPPLSCLNWTKQLSLFNNPWKVK